MYKRQKLLQAEVVVHDEHGCLLPHIAEVPGLVPSGDGDFGTGIAEDEPVLSTVVRKPGEELLVHPRSVHGAVLLVGDIHGEAGLVVTGTGSGDELGGVRIILGIRVVRPCLLYTSRCV